MFLVMQKVPQEDSLGATFDDDNSDNFTVESGYLCSDGAVFNIVFEGLDSYYHIDFYKEDKIIFVDVDLGPNDKLLGFHNAPNKVNDLQNTSQDFKVLFDNKDQGTIWENGKITHQECVLVAG